MFFFLLFLFFFLFFVFFRLSYVKYLEHFNKVSAVSISRTTGDIVTVSHTSEYCIADILRSALRCYNKYCRGLIAFAKEFYVATTLFAKILNEFEHPFCPCCIIPFHLRCVSFFYELCRVKVLFCKFKPSLTWVFVLFSELTRLTLKKS